MPRSRRDVDKRVFLGSPDDSQRIMVVRQFLVRRMTVGFDRQRQRKGGDPFRRADRPEIALIAGETAQVADSINAARHRERSLHLETGALATGRASGNSRKQWFGFDGHFVFSVQKILRLVAAGTAAKCISFGFSVRWLQMKFSQNSRAGILLAR